MAIRAFVARTLLGAFGTLLGVAFLFAAARASEIALAGGARGFVIHDPEETLRDFCHADANQLMWLELPGGARFELVTSTSDPAVLNSGDGDFHPFDATEVRAALAGVRYPIHDVGAEIFLLPYPRRGGLESAAGPGLILLAPGVRPLSAEHQHAEFVHELGHVVQYALMPDADAAAWSAYRDLRGIEDLGRYNSAGAHPDRPHEIFAEDFRALFGDPLATYSGTIENPELVPPAQVKGLGGFLESLAGFDPSPFTLAAFPNPARGPVAFTRRAGTPALLDLFDVTGRRLAALSPTMVPGGMAWRWDGRDATGRAVPSGAVFARVRGEREVAARVMLAP